MRRILVLTGVLGGGTAVVFALAAMTSALFPNGTMVSSSWSGASILQSVDMAAPMTGPAVRLGPITNATGRSMVIADDGVAGGMIKIQIDADGNPILDADGNPIVDNTGPQP